MGDWSEAMEDGVICRGCAMPMGGSSTSGYCDQCASNSRERGNPAPEPARDRLEKWKKETGQS